MIIYFLNVDKLSSDAPKPFGMNGGDSNLDKVGFERSIGFGSPETKFISKSATEKSTIIIEKRDEKDEIVECSPVKSIVYTKSINQMNSNTSSVFAVTEQPIIKKNLDYSSVTFNPVGPSNATATLASITTSNLAKIPIAKSIITPLANNNNNKHKVLNAKPNSSVSTKTANNNSTTNINLTKEQVCNKEKAITTPVKEIMPNERLKLIGTPGKHDGMRDVNQNLIAALKIDKNFLTKIVSKIFLTTNF